MQVKTVHYDSTKLVKDNPELLKEFKEKISISNILYLFFKDNECLYIGETAPSLKARCYQHTPKESESAWFIEGNRIHIIQLDDNIDKIARGTLESTFILAYRPKYNKKA
ncbi:TPA: GIY-YIG nuclease family protein [Clostridium perfringens]|uniref:GIY-YIG nuclease family protein n=1 Tax=Clostridium perfringens TaxID=1502 RepID=UPI0013A672AB|nr:GIY-YIG nuclease family protein [Clostridium perfringens]